MRGAPPSVHKVWALFDLGRKTGILTTKDWGRTL